MEGLANYLGTINLNKRPVIHNPDGSISTERSFSFSPDGQTEILVPQIVDGINLFKPAAVKHAMRTGEHLGVFNRPDIMQQEGLSKAGFYKWLENYANNIHNRQADYYKGK